MTKLNDLSGKKFGRLLVIERAPDHIQYNGRKRTQWKCICDCQTGSDVPCYTYVTSDRLLSGNTQSCGCIRQEYYDAKNKVRFEEKDEYYIGYTAKNEPFYFDKEKYEQVNKYTWFTNKEGYIVAYDNSQKEWLWLHRLCMGLSQEDDIKVDHIHGSDSRNDNRKSNLRLATNSQNTINTGIRRNNTTGVTGVSYNKNGHVYQVYICRDKKNHYLGRYKDFDEAVMVRKKAEEELFGEWSYDYSQQYNPEDIKSGITKETRRLVF